MLGGTPDPGGWTHARRRRALTGLLCLTAMAVLLAPAAARAADLPATPATLASVWASAQGGDRILLASGTYGFSGGSKSSLVTIAAQPGAAPTMSVSFTDAANIRLDGLT